MNNPPKAKIKKIKGDNFSKINKKPLTRKNPKSSIINNLYIINKSSNSNDFLPLSSMKRKPKIKKITIHIDKRVSFHSSLNKTIASSIYQNLKIEEKYDKLHHNENRTLNDQELNSLEYQLAINFDKRTYLQYYWSLLKKKHLIFFSFVPINDYNISSLKISLFLISFSLYFTINGFFFTDDTMHDIYSSNGSFNIFNQLSKILYSSIISIFIQQILKLLCLSESNILKLKHEEDSTIIVQKYKSIINCLMLKFIIFYFLGFCLIIFFWYFITCFCAVYHNTQNLLIKDTFLSFLISMVYPFGINLIPGLFRIPALKDSNKNRKCLYKIGLLVAFL